jgi:hypothetical protein
VVAVARGELVSGDSVAVATRETDAERELSMGLIEAVGLFEAESELFDTVGDFEAERVLRDGDWVSIACGDLGIIVGGGVKDGSGVAEGSGTQMLSLQTASSLSGFL